MVRTNKGRCVIIVYSVRQVSDTHTHHTSFLGCSQDREILVFSPDVFFFFFPLMQSYVGTMLGETQV